MRTHVFTRILSLSARYKRIALLSVVIGVLLLISSKALSFNTPLDDQISQYVPSKDSLLEYFGSDDKNDGKNILKDLTNSDTVETDESSLESAVKTHFSNNDRVDSQDFYSTLIKKFESFKSEIPKLEMIRKSVGDSVTLTKTALYEYLKLEPGEVAKFKVIHEEVYDILPDKFPTGLYKGTGVVFIGGAKYSWLSLLSIKSLRSFGCNLPIEMLIPTYEEYEHDLCEEILPSLGGKCILLSNVFGEDITKNIKFDGYQYKSLALIASSFDNVLLLDSDNIIISNPETYFKSEVYKKNGMLVWPDYWDRTTSPYFYDIVGIQVNESLRVRNGRWDLPNPVPVYDLSTIKYHDLKGALPDASTESGQIFIRKSDHAKTILLSFFYNYYGPNFFYTLLSQGNSGEGDKDTFIAAAVRSNERFYQIKSEIKTFGHKKSDGGFEGVSMGQRDPVKDYEEYSKLDLNHPENFDLKNIPVFTVHANFPKLNPYDLYNDKKLIGEDGKPFRLYSDISTFLPPVDGKPYDFEFIQFKRMKFLLCELNLSLKYFNKISRQELCEFIEGHVKFLKENPV